jgi:hypothetical protein
MPEVFLANCRPHNWDNCRQATIFGIKKGSVHPKIQRGDLFLMRVSGPDYGVRGIWAFESERKVEKPSDVPWTDADYEWLLSFSPLVLEFHEPFNEEFEGKSKYSEKIKLNAGRIVTSVVHLSPDETRNYLEPLVSEKREDLKATARYLTRDIVVADLLSEVIKRARVEVKAEAPKKREEIPDVVGEPINFRGMVYAPMNEAGVILLFSKVMHNLGIIYESSPSRSFPDMIARRKEGTGEGGWVKRYIEFEYKSSHFKAHNHDPDKCDVIVCWIHDWTDCPLEVIELKELVGQLSEVPEEDTESA